MNEQRRQILEMLAVVRGRITKQGSRPLRWALVEAIQRTPAGTPVRQALAALCQQLTAVGVRYPGTDLVLRY
jgi:hypothetical protein